MLNDVHRVNMVGTIQAQAALGSQEHRVHGVRRGPVALTIVEHERQLQPRSPGHVLEILRSRHAMTCHGLEIAERCLKT